MVLLHPKAAASDMKVRLFSKGELPETHRPLCHKSRLYVDQLATSGEAFYLDDTHTQAQLTGWHRNAEPNFMEQMIAGRFDKAWAIRQSGWAGPLVWQLNR